MFPNLVEYYVRKVLRKVGIRHISEKNTIPTYRGVNVVLDEDPYRHVEISAAIRYVNGLEQPCRIDPVSCEDWKIRREKTNVSRQNSERV